VASFSYPAGLLSRRTSNGSQEVKSGDVYVGEVSWTASPQIYSVGAPAQSSALCRSSKGSSDSSRGPHGSGRFSVQCSHRRCADTCVVGSLREISSQIGSNAGFSCVRPFESPGRARRYQASRAPCKGDVPCVVAKARQQDEKRQY